MEEPVFIFLIYRALRPWRLALVFWRPFKGILKASQFLFEGFLHAFKKPFKGLFEGLKKQTFKTHSNTSTNIILGDGQNKYWSSFPPLPIPGVAKVPSPGGIFFICLNIILMTFHDFHNNKMNKLIHESFKKQMQIIYWVMDRTNIGPYLLPPRPPPHPHPRRGKSSWGQFFKLKTWFWWFPILS